MKKINKIPREFDLHFLYGSAKVQAKNNVFILNEETIHVIEHSAYLAVKQELDAARTKIEELKEYKWQYEELCK